MNFLLVLLIDLHIYFDRAVSIGEGRNLDRFHVSHRDARQLYLGAVAQASGFREIGFERVGAGKESHGAADEEYSDHEHDESRGYDEADAQLCPLQLFTLSHKSCSLQCATVAD